LPLPVRVGLDRLITKLGSEPRFPGVRRLRGTRTAYPARVGEYRVIYTIDDGQRIVHILRIARRDEAYRRLFDLPFD
jgi:mRNA interferase RelE/StbE